MPEQTKTTENPAADECASCLSILEGVAEILHNQTTDRTAAQAYNNSGSIMGFTEDHEMRIAAKALRNMATSFRVRELKIRKGEL